MLFSTWLLITDCTYKGLGGRGYGGGGSGLAAEGG